MGNPNGVQTINNIYTNICRGMVEKGIGALIMLQGSARCFAPGTLIRMYDGTCKRVEDIKVGDKVMNHTGDGFNTVTETHSGVDMMYRIHAPRLQHDVIVNSKHILSLKQTHSFMTHGANKVRKPIPYDKDAIVNISVEDYLTKSRNWKENHCLFKQTKIQMPERELPIDPYYLGVWLGDGTACRWNEITNNDQEILDWFSDFAKTLDTSTVLRDGYTWKMNVAGRYRADKINGKVDAMYKAFKSLNLINNKHVPDIYLNNSYENRMRLLAGLIDSDGYVTRRGTIGITQKKRQIMESIQELCNTCGFFTYGITSKIAKMKRQDGSVYECEVYLLELNDNTFNELNKYLKVERKKIKGKNCNRDYYTTKPIVTQEGIGEYYGFSLSLSPYFLDDQGLLLHNSGKTYNIMIFLIQACVTKKIVVTVTRFTLPVLKGSVFKDFLQIMSDMGIYDAKRMNKTTMEYTFENGSVMEFRAFDDEQKARGPSRDILFCNEANELEEAVFNNLRDRTRMYTIIDFNPTFTEEHWIFPLIHEQRTYHFISTFMENDFLSDAIRNNLMAYKYTSPAHWRIFGMGEFAIVEGLVFAKEAWDTCNFTDIPIDCHRMCIGIDFGYTQDPTAAVQVFFKNVGTEQHLWVHELIYETGLKERNIAHRLKQYNDVPKMVDSAAPLVVDNLEDNGMQMVYPVNKYSGSIVDGVQKMLGYHIHVTKTSVNVMKELRNYCWMKDRHDKWTNTPIDKFNHAMDALRYCVMSDKSARWSGLNKANQSVYSKQDLGFYH